MLEAIKSMVRWFLYRCCLRSVTVLKEERDTHPFSTFYDICLLAVCPTRHACNSWVFDSEADLQFFELLSVLLGGPLKLVDLVYLSEMCTLQKGPLIVSTPKELIVNMCSKHPRTKLRYISYVAKCKNRSGMDRWCKLMLLAPVMRSTAV